MPGFLKNRAVEPGQGGRPQQAPSGCFSNLPHPFHCEQAGAQPGCAAPDPHKLCTSLPFLDGELEEL